MSHYHRRFVLDVGKILSQVIASVLDRRGEKSMRNMTTCILDSSSEEYPASPACYLNHLSLRVSKQKREGTHTHIESLPDELLLQCLCRVSGSDAGPGCILLRGVSKRWRRLVCSPAFFHIRHSINRLEPWLITLTGRLEGGLLCKLFDPSSERCQRLPCSWEAIKERHRYGTTVVGQEIFVLGGYQSDPENPNSKPECTPNVDAYNPVLDRARLCAPMLQARSNFACCSGNGQIFVLGGLDREGNCLLSAEVYLIAENRWETIKEMPRARTDCIAEYIQGRIYVLRGGKSKSEPNTWEAMVDAYDSLTGTWHSVCDVPMEKSRFQTAVVYSRLCVIGGHKENPYVQECFNTPFVLDQEDNEWKLWKRGLAYPSLRCIAGAQSRIFCHHSRCRDLQGRPFVCLSAKDELFLIRRCDNPYCRHIHRFVPSLADTRHGTSWQCIPRKSRFSSLLLEAGDCWQHAVAVTMHY